MEDDGRGTRERPRLHGLVRSIASLEISARPAVDGPCSSSRTKGLPVVSGSLERVVAHAKLKGIAQN